MAENTTSAFKTMFEEAYRLVQAGQFSEADSLCSRLLQEPTLPLLYRAGCNLMLSTGENRPVEFAQEAVRWYQEMYDEVREDPVDGPKHLSLLEQAQDALELARRRVAARNDALEDVENDVEGVEDDDMYEEEEGDDNDDAKDTVEQDDGDADTCEDRGTQ